MEKGELDPKGYWGDPQGNIRRMSGEQEIVATVTPECNEAEWKALCALGVDAAQSTEGKVLGSTGAAKRGEAT